MAITERLWREYVAALDALDNAILTGRGINHCLTLARKAQHRYERFRLQ